MQNSPTKKKQILSNSWVMELEMLTFALKTWDDFMDDTLQILEMWQYFSV